MESIDRACEGLKDEAFDAVSNEYESRHTRCVVKTANGCTRSVIAKAWKTLVGKISVVGSSRSQEQVVSESFAVSLLVGIGASVLGMILWKIWVGRLTESIVGRVRSRRSRRRHRLYVRCAIGAVRGHAARTNIGVLVIAVVAACGLAFLLTYAGILVVDHQIASAERQRAQLKRLASVAQGGDGTTATPPSESAPPISSDYLLDVVDRVVVSGERVKRIFWTLVAGQVAGVLWVLLIWAPFLAVRGYFTFELTRFTLRIQGLAKKEEIAILAEREAQVLDESSLKRYIAATHEVASRHGVPQLVRPFDLWGSFS